MNEILVVVNELTLVVWTVPASEDPYGQGCAGIRAEAQVDENSDIELLLDAARRRAVVTLHCASLFVKGNVKPAEGETQRFVVLVDEVVQRKPKGPWESSRLPSGLRPD